MTRAEAAAGIDGVPFGMEVTPAEHRARAAWERAQAARVLAGATLGCEHLAEGHENAARAYDTRADEIETGEVLA